MYYIGVVNMTNGKETNMAAEICGKRGRFLCTLDKGHKGAHGRRYRRPCSIMVDTGRRETDPFTGVVSVIEVSCGKPGTKVTTARGSWYDCGGHGK